jgi:hypothetical protein
VGGCGEMGPVPRSYECAWIGGCSALALGVVVVKARARQAVGGGRGRQTGDAARRRRVSVYLRADGRGDGVEEVSGGALGS